MSLYFILYAISKDFLIVVVTSFIIILQAHTCTHTYLSIKPRPTLSDHQDLISIHLHSFFLPLKLIFQASCQSHQPIYWFSSWPFFWYNLPPCWPDWHLSSHHEEVPLSMVLISSPTLFSLITKHLYFNTCPTHEQQALFLPSHSSSFLPEKKVHSSFP